MNQGHIDVAYLNVWDRHGWYWRWDNSLPNACIIPLAGHDWHGPFECEHKTQEDSERYYRELYYGTGFV